MVWQSKVIAIAIIVSLPTMARAEATAQRKALPPDSVREAQVKVFDTTDLDSIYTRKQGVFSKTPIQLDATYNEALSLREALLLTLRHNLPIAIARENWNYQRYQLLAALAGIVPTYSLQYGLTGTHVAPITNAHSFLFVSQVRYPVFQGGAIFYNVLSQYYRDVAWKCAYKSTVSDKLLEVFTLYNNLSLQDTLLSIQAKSVLLDEEFLKYNLAMYDAGTNTQYGVMEARTQLLLDREKLSKQEASRRQAALALAFALNVPLSANLVTKDRVLKVANIIDQRLRIGDCLDLALKNRAELRQYELFRFAAARSVQAAASSLYPQLSFFSAYTRTHVTVSPPQNGNLLNGEAAGQVAAAQESQGNVVTNTALNQTASISPDSKNTGTEGANMFATVVAGGGGSPIANVQGGSLVTSGAVAPIFGASSVTGRTGSSNINGANTASAGVFPGASTNIQNGFSLSWTLSNMGLSNLGNIMSARALSRQALLQANQELQLVCNQVRSAYVQILWLNKRIDCAASTTQSARNALQFSEMRLKAGVGNNLEVIYARRDYIKALSYQASAIAELNQVQAQLLYNMGLVSIDKLTAGRD